MDRPEQQAQQEKETKLSEIRQKIRTCEVELENAEQLHPVAVLSGDTELLTEHEQLIFRLKRELEQLRAEEATMQATS